MINYDNKTFRSIENTENGEVGGHTIFHYKQKDNIVTATYSGGSIVEGHLIALVLENGDLTMRYHHVNTQNVLMTGKCRSIPEILSNGKIRLHEIWQWTSGDESHGRSIVEEI
jgi:hypothetical protein